MNEDEAVELYRRYRPKTLKGVVGQPNAVAQLTDLIAKNNLPRALLFTGGSGVGKTTIARSLINILGCGGMDFKDINCALVEKPTDCIRAIAQEVHLSPVSGRCRIWLLDEAQAFSKAGFAQQAMLKILEDIPKRCYFFLCTTDPDKLHKAIRTRCTTIALQPVPAEDLRKLLTYVCTQEQTTITKAVQDRIVEVADGSARQALVFLHKVIGLDDEKDQLNAIVNSDDKRQAFEIVKALLWEKTNWQGMVRLLTTIEVADPERFRHLVLTCAKKEMLKGGRNSSWGYLIGQAFRDHWYDCPEIGLELACYEVLSDRK